MPLPKLKYSLSVKLALDSVLQIHELIFQLWQLHPKKLSKALSETCAKWSQFGTVSETQGLAKIPPVDGYQWKCMQLLFSSCVMQFQEIRKKLPKKMTPGILFRTASSRD